MPQTQTFYCHFKKNWFWLLSNLKQLITKKTRCFFQQRVLIPSQTWRHIILNFRILPRTLLYKKKLHLIETNYFQQSVIFLFVSFAPTSEIPPVNIGTGRNQCLYSLNVIPFNSLF